MRPSAIRRGSKSCSSRSKTTRRHGSPIPNPRPLMTTHTPDRAAAVLAVADAIRARQRIVLSSHARPDGDAVGSQLAMAFAVDALGKEVTLVNRDPVPGPLLPFPGTDRIVVADHV